MIDVAYGIDAATNSPLLRVFASVVNGNKNQVNIHTSNQHMGSLPGDTAVQFGTNTLESEIIYTALLCLYHSQTQSLAHKAIGRTKSSNASDTSSSNRVQSKSTKLNHNARTGRLAIFLCVL